MLQRRYPHSRAGGVAAAAFLVAGFAGGWFVAGQLSRGPGALAGGIVWALVSAGVAYLVFASEGPARRPESSWQASMGDGVVAGATAGFIGAVIDLLVAAGAGSSPGASVSGGTIAGTIAASIGAGAAVGALVGLAIGSLRVMVRVQAPKKKREDRKPRASAASPTPAKRSAPSAGAAPSTRTPASRKEKRR
jgi:hypothetical protein